MSDATRVGVAAGWLLGASFSGVTVSGLIVLVVAGFVLVAVLEWRWT